MLAALVLLGYLAGSIPFGVLVTRWARGVDVREEGSGNIGATNVARVAGRKLGILVLVLDAPKGALPVLLALRMMPDSPRAQRLISRQRGSAGRCRITRMNARGRWRSINSKNSTSLGSPRVSGARDLPIGPP